VNVGVYFPTELIEEWRRVTGNLRHTDVPSLSKLCQKALREWLSEQASQDPGIAVPIRGEAS